MGGIDLEELPEMSVTKVGGWLREKVCWGQRHQSGVSFFGGAGLAALTGEEELRSHSHVREATMQLYNPLLFASPLLYDNNTHISLSFNAPLLATRLTKSSSII
jgi:hypothetical protein